MKKLFNRKNILLISILFGVIFLLFFALHETRKVTDKTFNLLEKQQSPDQQHIALNYNFDTGAFGYSREFWAIVPKEYRSLNLVKYELPDGYRTVGWASDGTLIIEKWNPYYYLDEKVDLKTDDTLYGVHIQVNNETNTTNNT